VSGRVRSAARPGWLPAPRPGIVRALAWAAAVLLDRTGFVARAARRRAARGAPLVLAFRRVVAPDEMLASEPDRVVTAATFERMIASLRGASGFIELSHVERVLSADAAGYTELLPVIVTFDGGWRDTEEVVEPILRAHDVPRAVFLSASFVGTARLDWPERAFAPFATYERRQRARYALRHLGLPLDSGPLVFVTRLRTTPETEREALLASIVAPRTADPPAYLSWDAVRRMKSAGATIGLYGIEVGEGKRLAEEEADAELAAARDRIARETGEAPLAIAIPGGRATDVVVAAARRAGYRRAFVTGHGGPDAADRFAISRRAVDEGTGAVPFGAFSPSLFLCELLGLFDGHRRALAAARRAGLPATILLLALLLAAQAPVVRSLITIWATSPSDAHGLVVPGVALSLAWRKRDRIAASERKASWKGAALLATGLLGGVLAIAGSSQSGQFLALILSVWGVVWARHGDRAVATLAVPLLTLLLAIPVPWGLGLALSLPLRHASSVVGVGLAQAFGAPALLEGNVIHMAEVSLNVDDACSGIRSLVALIVLSILYLSVRETPIGRSAVVMVALPALTIAANGLRLFVTVLAVRAAGPDFAHGAAHASLGVATFAAALGGLTFFERLLRWRGPDRRPASSSPS